jgi:glutamate transport system substrate-binding protein
MVFPVLVLALALVTAGCGNDEDEETTATTARRQSQTPPSFAVGSTMAAIQAKGKLVVGTKFDQPGLGQRNPTNNQVEGFDVEIAKILAVGIFGGTVDNIGDKVQFVETVSKNREPFIQNGNVDIVIATYTINDARKQVVDFAGPYFLAHQDMLVKSSDNSIKTVTDLNGKKACSVTGSTSEKNVKAKAPQVDVLALDNYSQCVQALLDGRVVAVTTDDAILAGYATQNPGQLKVVGAPFSDEPYGVGLKKGDDAFREFLNTTLEASFSNGTWSRAFQSTLGKSGFKEPPPPTINRYTSTGPATTTAGGATTTTGARTTSTTRP